MFFGMIIAVTAIITFGVWLGDTAAAAQIAVVVIGGMFGVAGTSRGVKKEGGNGPPNNTVTK